MTALEDRLQRLEDRQEIGDLIARYGPLVDAGQGAALAEDWTADACYTGAGFAFTGRAEIAALPAFPAHQAFMTAGCAHVMGPHVITLSGDTATARGVSLVVPHDSSGGSFHIKRASANLWQFRRTREGWKIAGRENRLIDGGAAARALLSP